MVGPHVRDAVFELAAICKNEAFEDEREVRMIYKQDPVSPDPLQNNGIGKKQFRISDDGILIPFVSTADLVIGGPGLAKWHQQQFPLHEVLVGPHAKADLAALGIKEYLDTIGLGHVQVVKSDVPYR